MVIAGLRRSLRASTAVCTRPPSAPSMLPAIAVPAFSITSLNICPIPLEATAFISLFGAWVSPPPGLVLGLGDCLLGLPHRPGDCLQIAGDIVVVGLDQLQP